MQGSVVKRATDMDMEASASRIGRFAPGRWAWGRFEHELQALKTLS